MYIKDLEDGDMLMDMMSANAGFERTVAKRGENIYPEVRPPPPPLPNTDGIVFLLSTYPSRTSVRNSTFRGNLYLPLQLPRSHGLESHSRGETLLDCRKRKYQSRCSWRCCCDTSSP